MPPPLDGFDDGCIAEMENLYFMSYYFPKRLLTEYGNHETDQNKLTRDWILKLKRLAFPINCNLANSASVYWR